MLSEAHACFYAVEILLALEYLHATGCCYRDLKAENVLLRATCHIALCDFDLASSPPAWDGKLAIGAALVGAAAGTAHRAPKQGSWSHVQGPATGASGQLGT